MLRHCRCHTSRRLGPHDTFLDTNSAQMAKHDMCGPLRPSMLAINHLGRAFFLDTATLKLLFGNIGIFIVLTR